MSSRQSERQRKRRREISLSRHSSRSSSPSYSVERAAAYSQSFSKNRSYTQRYEERERCSFGGVSDSISNTSIAQLADAIKVAVRGDSDKRTMNIDAYKDLIPVFDGNEELMSAEEWIRKITSVAEVYDWSDKMMLHLAITRLSGLAREWFDQLHGVRLDWSEFCYELKQIFPEGRRFGKLFHDAALYCSSDAKDLSAYCVVKIGKIKRLRLDLSEEQMVDAIVEGITDGNVRSNIKSMRCQTIMDLKNVMSVYNGSTVLSSDSNDDGSGENEETLSQSSEEA